MKIVHLIPLPNIETELHKGCPVSHNLRGNLSIQLR